MSRPEEQRDWLFGAVMASIVMISVALAVGAAIVGFFVGRDTKHPKPSAVPTSTQVAAATVDPHVAAGGTSSCNSPAVNATGLRAKGACRRWFPP